MSDRHPVIRAAILVAAVAGIGIKVWLGPADTPQDNRRVLAVLGFLRAWPNGGHLGRFRQLRCVSSG